MTTQTLFTTQGCDLTINKTIRTADQTAINIAGYAFNGAVRQNPYSNYPIANLVITKTDAPNGNLTISMNAAVSSNMGIGSYVYIVTQNVAGVTTVLLSGDMIISPSALVTQPLPANVTNQVLDDYFEALQGQNSFYLSYTPANTSNVQIVYNNVLLANQITTYTITGKVLIFANVAAQGDIIQAKEPVPVVVL